MDMDQCLLQVSLGSKLNQEDKYLCGTLQLEINLDSYKKDMIKFSLHEF